MSKIGNDASATPVEQARFVFGLLVDIGGRCLFQTLCERSNLSQRQVSAALQYLNSMGYVGCRVRGDSKVVYSVTFLGHDAVALLQELETEQWNGA